VIQHQHFVIQQAIRLGLIGSEIARPVAVPARQPIEPADPQDPVGAFG
jgi:hypothetical protein